MNVTRSSLIAAATLLASSAAFAQSADALYTEGNRAWDNNECVRASRHYFALQVRFPEVVPGSLRQALNSRIGWCERNTSIHSGSKTDDPGGGGRPRKPDIPVPNAIVVPPPPTVAPDGQCNLYAKLAVAHYQASVLDACGYSGNRWHGDFRVHYNWCTTVGNAQRDRENVARQQALVACHQR